MSVMRPEVMSSAEISEDDGEEVIVVHQLPWLTKEVAVFKQQLDDEIIRRNKALKHAFKQSVESLDVLQQDHYPTDEHFPTWALVN